MGHGHWRPCSATGEARAVSPWCRADPALRSWRTARGQQRGLSMAKESPRTANAGESVGDRNPLPHSGSVNWCSRCEEQDGGCSENHRRRPHGPAVPLPGTDPDRTVTWKDTYVHPCAHSSRAYANQDTETSTSAHRWMHKGAAQGCKGARPSRKQQGERHRVATWMDLGCHTKPVRKTNTV